METRNFTHEEKVLHINCIELFQEMYPNLELDGKYISELYNENKDPNMRRYEDIN